MKSLTVLVLIAGSLAALDLPLTIQNWATVPRQNEPLTMGIPLPIGLASDVSSFTLVNEVGKTVPAQFRPLSKYWKEKTSGSPSIKWMLCDAQVSVDAKNTVQWFLRTGTGNPLPTKQINLTENADSIIVDNGPLHFSLSRTHFNLFDELFFDADSNGTFNDSEKMIAKNNHNGTQIRAASWTAGECTEGIVHEMYNQQPEKIVVEENGPLKAVIRIEGRHYASTNGVSKGLYGWQIFLTVYAGKPYVDVQVAITNIAIQGVRPQTGIAPYTMTVWPFREASLHISLSQQGPWEYRMLSDLESNPLPISSDTAKLLQIPGSFSVNGAAAGKDALGGALLSNSKVGMMVVMKDFAPNSPKQIKITSGQIIFDLLPDTGNGLYWLDPFTRKSSRFRVQFFAGSSSNNQLLNCWKKHDAPIRMLAPKEWYRNTNPWEKGFGIGNHASFNRIPISSWNRLKKSSSDSIRTTQGVYKKNDWTTYGYVSEFNGGGEHWNISTAFWPYLLSGAPDSFERAESRAIYGSEMVTTQTSSSRMKDYKFWLEAENNIPAISQLNTPEELYKANINSFPNWAFRRTNPGKTTSNYPDAGHMPFKAIHEYYLLTGDWGAYDAVLSEGIRGTAINYWQIYGSGYNTGWPYSKYQGRKAVLDSVYAYSYGTRYIARPALVSLTAYDLTGDTLFLNSSRLAIYSLRNLSRRCPFGLSTQAASGLYITTYNDSVWKSENTGTTAPVSYSEAAFQLAIGTQALYYYWQQTADPEIVDAIILNGKAEEWRMGKDNSTGTYTGFITNGWGDYICSGKRYYVSDWMYAPKGAGEAYEPLCIMSYAYMSSRSPFFYKILNDALTSTRLKNYYFGGNSLTSYVSSGWLEAAYVHDSLETVPPAAVNDLKAVSETNNGIRITFTAPGGNGNSGRVARYRLKYSRSPIVDTIRHWNPLDSTGWPDMRGKLPTTKEELTFKAAQYISTQECSFWAAQACSEVPIPSPAGTEESFLVHTPDTSKYYFALVSYDSNGNVSAISNIVNTTGVSSESSVDVTHTNTGIYAVTPNPFNPQTEIQIRTDKPTRVTLSIYGSNGRLINTILQSELKTGSHKVRWNGIDSNGKAVGTGTYICKLTCGGKTFQKRLVLLK